MTILDRYLARLFIKVLLICFISLSGLYIVIDGFNNTDEFAALGQRSSGGIVVVLAEYYGPRMLWFFDKTAGLMALIATAFALVWLQRTNELTALMAAGVSRVRVLGPLLISAIAVAGLGIANRELGLPAVRERLARNAQDWLGDQSRKCTPRYDIQTDVLISGKSTYAKDRRIVQPLFRLPAELWGWGRQIVATDGFQTRATADHPAGYLLKGVKQPDLDHLASAELDGRRVLYSPLDTPWLKKDECFVVSVVSFEQLTVGGAWRQYLSSYELITGLHNRTIEPGADVRVTLHARVVQPLLDMALVVLGIPLVLTKGSRSIFLAAGICVVVVAVLFLVTIVCHGLGSNYLLDPTLAAWIPLVVFGPLAYTLARPLWD